MSGEMVEDTKDSICVTRSMVMAYTYTQTAVDSKVTGRMDSKMG